MNAQKIGDGFGQIGYWGIIQFWDLAVLIAKVDNFL